jgi:hypothetical protein
MIPVRCSGKRIIIGALLLGHLLRGPPEPGSRFERRGSQLAFRPVDFPKHGENTLKDPLL